MNQVPIQKSNVRVPTFDVMSSHIWNQKKETDADYYESFALGETVSTDIDPNKQNSPTSPFKLGFDTIKTTELLFDSPIKVPKTERNERNNSYSPIKEILAANNGICRENYLTEADKLLERGYLIVEGREEEKKSILIQKASLEKSLMKVQKDILPEMKRTKELQEELEVCKGIQAKHTKDIQSLNIEIQKYKNLIKNTAEVNKKKEKLLLMDIEWIEQDVDVIRKEATRSRMKGREKIEKLEQKVVNAEGEKKTLNEELSYLKKRLAETKKQHIQKQSILEEKARTFCGILQCK